MFYTWAWKLLKYAFGLYAAYQTYLVLRNVIIYKLLVPLTRKPIAFNKDYYRKQAVITGCTDGIGKAFTYELASVGLDLILISRSEKKLEELAADLRSKYKIETKIIPADFKNTSEVIPSIRKQLENEDIGVLINNVGIALPVGRFLDNNKVKVNNLVEVNVKSMVSMCSIVMENMVKKRKGIIINVSSILSSLPSPRFATVYGASKAFVKKFSQDLHDEYKNHGIIVHCLTTGPVVTKLFKVNITNWLTPTPERYVRSALKTVGIGKVTTGYSSHDIIELTFNMLIAISPELYERLMLKAESAFEKHKDSATTENQQPRIQS